MSIVEFMKIYFQVYCKTALKSQLLNDDSCYVKIEF